jgi:hypothetical protein
MNATPMLACGPGGEIILLLLFAPFLNCAVAFLAGAICYRMGNKGLGGWTMSLALALGIAVYALFPFL